jgi:hypothetical protein
VLIAQGVPDTQIALRLGLPRTTVRDWRRPPYVRVAVTSRCERCWRAMTPVRFASADYAELLGLYLGDGDISTGPRTERLRISLDSRHATIVDETEALLTRCFPRSGIGRATRHHRAMAILSVYHSHLSCLFPQHGPGKKQDRRIVLEPWQEALVAAAPWSFLKGCIRSDGCVFINRTGPYEYLSYDFTNHSSDILELFVSTCASLGLRPRRYAVHARLCKRADVALLIEHVGTKN